MNPTRIAARGMLSLRDVDLDLASLPTDALVAVAGANGAGKTSLLELMSGGALYRRLASRGSLLDAATGKSSALVVDFEHCGTAYRASHLLDPAAAGGRGKAEAYLEADGAPLAPGRVRDFDELVARLFPSPAVFFASAYAAQGGGGSFASLDVAGRRALFADLLGLADLQRLADAAAERRRAALVEAAVAEDALRVASADLAALGQCEVELDAAVEAERRAREGVAALTARREQVDAAVDVAAAVQRARAEVRSAQDRELVARKALSAMVEQLRSREARAALLGDLEARQAEIEALTAQRDKLVSEWQALAAKRAPVLARLEAARGRRNDALDALGYSLDRPTVEAIEERDARRKDLAAAKESARAEALGLAAHSERLWAHEDQLAAAHRREREALGNLDRARASAERVAGYPCSGRTLQAEDGERVDCATCPVVRGDLGFDLEGLEALAAKASGVVEAATAERLRLDEELVARRQRVAAHDRDVALLSAGVADLDHLVKRLAERDEAARAFAEAEAEASALPPEGDLVAQGRALRERLDALSAGHRQALDAARLAASQVEADREAVGRYEAAVDEGRHEIVNARHILRSLVEDLVSRGDALRDVWGTEPHAPFHLGDEAGLDRATRWPADERRAVDEALAAATRTAQEAARVVGRAEAAVGRLRELQRAHGERERRAATAGLEVGAAALLARGLGPEGLQAVRVDAAGPEVGDLATDLLGACYGRRFAVELRTLREGTGARKDRETLDLVVHDARGGRPRVFGDLSGGEQVVVDEALRLAIAVYRARRAPGLETLWRDEADGRLDPERAAGYPDMLRAAMRLGRFRRCYFVSHRPEVAAQADARIVVADGTARIEL